MKNLKLSSFLISILPIFLASSFIALLLFLFTYAEPAYAFSGGYALNFDGEDDLVVLTETSRIFSGNWEDTKTVSLWVRPQGMVKPCGDWTDPFTPINAR